MSGFRLQYPPVFFIGMPRSGTTILFEKFVASSRFGWLSNYSEIMPAYPALNLLRRLFDNDLVGIRGKKKQYGRVLPGNRYLPQPDEAYAFWDHYARADFSRDYLLGRVATGAERARVSAAVGSTLKYQGKVRFATKLTGPGRICYLNSIFPDAKFVHVVRDGRAVTESLLRVGFWKEKGGFEHPFWNNGLDAEALRPWRESGDPAILAALQWVKVIHTTREEAAALSGEDRFTEIRYEDYVREPVGIIDRLYDFAGVDNADAGRAEPGDSSGIMDMSRKYQQQADRSIEPELNTVLSATLQELGYEVDAY